ncbi:alcohol dehydrogenase EutG [Rhodococcus sp. 05-339-2]|uniref:iron-containing alcohol dehydrogenase n=1 Tax=Rhodococcoides fascians TaxID=1828 RepID=UPI00050C39B8|nr:MULTISPECIES: iron-containing alcohol dehydrogenase [Rhodococcus]OZD74950.1 alcohol dehydrogenase EutG [Rhodococcus sp. 05-339-2]
MVSNISFPRFLKLGGGAVEELGTVLTDLDVSRPLLVTDAFMAGNGSADRLMKIMTEAGKTPALFSGTVPDPTTDSLVAGLDAVQQHSADSIIGFGGGSPMDTAKALAILAVQGGTMRDFKAPVLSTGPSLPIIAIPTTAGSGSEATQFTIITDVASDEKMLCPGLSFLPIASIIDFELTMSMPARLTADTGVDALTHAIEAYVSKKANPISDGLALSAIRTIGTSLLRAYRDGDDRQAREAMMHASTQAGMAFSNASVCLVHGMSRPIGAHFHVAHGLSNAMLLPAVTAFSIDGAQARYADCARALGAASESDSDQLAGGKLQDAIVTLCRAVEVPTPETFGIEKAKWDQLLPLMAEQALASGSPGNNPVVPTAEQIVDLYRQVYAGI